jgi:superfamily II DNA or RNA helicase
MNEPIVVASLADVRHLIAHTVLGVENVDARLGEIELRPHQTRAASRLATIIATHGGAMLAEPVGVGKTYTALAVAARCVGPVLVVAPASLKAMWLGAAQRCGLAVDFTSHEALSRGTPARTIPRFVIVDEAHRVRTTTTRRYALLADLCSRSDVLLVTATPVHNKLQDLAAQLALFLGRAAWSMSDDQLVDYVVRDSGSSLGARPRLDGPHRVSLDVDDDCLDALLSLPSPVPAKDESLSAALLCYGLVHQWTSSRAALVASLKRRRSRGYALAAALESGRRPTRGELSAWTHAGDALQLAFPEIVAPELAGADVDTSALRAAIDRHSESIDTLLRRLRDLPDPDVARAHALRRIRELHPGERIIAFCQYAETVAVLWGNLARDPGVAALTAAGARVAGGAVRRDDLLAQFMPSPTHTTPDVERVSILITTDLLSEGLNLQEASVIVHLDLPWNPARLDQRVGRALRLGSRHATVTVYAIAPPATAERLLRIEARLREKLSVAQRTVGVAGRILPSPLGRMPVGDGLADQRSVFDRELRAWRDPSRRVAQHIAVAAVRAPFDGFLALVGSAREPTLVADVGAGAETNTPAILRAIAACRGDEVVVDAGRARAANDLLASWLEARTGAQTLNLTDAASTRARRATLARVAQALARAPRHQRARLVPLVDAARSAASARLAEGAERVLETLVRAELPDEAWLRSIAAFGALNARPSHRATADAGVIAIILLATE